MRLGIVPVLAIFAVTGCGLFSPDERGFAEYRVYAHDLFPTPADCKAAQEQYFVNCAQIAEFCPGGRAILMVTDILNPGSYSIFGDRLTIRFSSGSEVGPSWSFDVSPGQDTLTDAGGRFWVRDAAREQAHEFNPCA